MGDLSRDLEFSGTSRFRVLERIGRGGMGAVYRVFDVERNVEVALKTLLKRSAADLLRFKKEFRALADVSHPNLVSLHELATEGDQWFFTMELLRGVDLISYVRGASPDGAGPAGTAPTVDDEPSGPDGADSDTTITRVTGVEGPSTDRGPPPVDLERLRGSLRQLAGGIQALHASGHLHRDIKPSNVMVTPEGRVVLLDFGVITELAGVDRTAAVERVGTPLYMAPEQVGGRACPASDWYSVGVMLYDALTGRPPFAGSSDAIMREKQLAEPAPPRLVRDDTPEDLDRLCVELLRLEPERRPAGEEVLRRLGSEPGGRGQGPARAAVAGDQPAPLFGREVHLRRLHELFAATRAGAGATVLLHGASGMGKTALVRRFLSDLRMYDGAVVLAGRCYERESLPYKAVDGLIDALCGYLLQLSDAEVDALLPRDSLMLAQVFPVLRRVGVVSRARRRGPVPADPQEVRRRAFIALRDLLGRLAERRPLALFIDDAQWGDADSAPLLDALLRPPDVPPLLLLVSYRTDEEARSPLLAGLRASGGHVGAGPVVHEITVGPLAESDAQALAVSLLDPGGGDSAAVIARESRGHPYFVHELARFVRDAGRTGAGELTLDAVIRERVARLPEAARRLLEVIAVAGRPMPMLIAQQAAGLDPARRPELVQQLRAAQLVRSSGSRDDDAIECYHDRIREILVAQLAERAVDHHRRLAYAHQSSAHPDPETLLIHFHACGERELAGDYAVIAARRAEASLSFERAAELYRIAIGLREPGPEERRELATRCGESLESAGRGADAAPMFLAAAELAGGIEALELRRRAAEQYLRSGYITEGLALLRQVLAAVGIRYPRTPRRGIAGMLVRRAQLRLRGLGFRPRSPDLLAAADVAPADACWSAAIGLAQVDPARAGVFGSRTLLLSLRAGDARRVARALIIEGCFVATGGSDSRRRTAVLVERAEAVAREVDDPTIRAQALALHAFTAFEQGRFLEAHERCEEALGALADCRGTVWEAGSMQLFSLVALCFVGDFDRIRRLAPERLAAAQSRGDLYTITNIRAMISPALRMAADDPDGAEREAVEAIARWPQEGFHNQHFMALVMKTQADLHRGDGPGAYQRCLESEPALKGSWLMFVQIIRGYWRFTRASAALAAARQQPAEAGRLIRVAARDARQLLGEGATWCRGFGHLVSAGVAEARGKPEATMAGLRRAVEVCEEAELRMHGAAARRALGLQLGGDEGAALVADADARMIALGITSPARIAGSFTVLARR